MNKEQLTLSAASGCGWCGAYYGADLMIMARAGQGPIFGLSSLKQTHQVGRFNCNHSNKFF